MEEKKIINGAKIFVLILGLVYGIITIMAAVSAIGDIKNSSSTEVGISNIVSLIWFQVLVVVFFVLDFYIYSKKGRTGIILEFVIGLALLINVIVNIIVSGAYTPLVLLNFAIPVLVLVHSFVVLYGIYRLKKEVKLKELFNLK